MLLLMQLMMKRMMMRIDSDRSVLVLHIRLGERPLNTVRTLHVVVVVRDLNYYKQ